MSKRKLQVEKCDKVKVNGDYPVITIVEGNRHYEVICMAKPSKGGVIKKLSADEFVDLRTGEVRKFEKNDSKQRENLRETFNNLKALIRTNFDADNEHKQLFITLTYAENMTEYRRLYVDFDKWLKRLKYHLKGHHLEYIAVAEPQERGAWHMHVMLKSDRFLYLDNETVTSPMWGHGWTDTQRLKSDDVGRYYVAYFTDLFGECGATAKKKGARLPFYPVGMKFFRCSRGVNRPERVSETYREATSRGGEMAGWGAFTVKNEDGAVVQMVQREHWKKEEIGCGKEWRPPRKKSEITKQVREGV
jgi:hypothetical protein